MKNKLNSIKILKVIENNKENIRKYGVKRLGLFGSFAKNKQTSKSDIDILVEFDYVKFRNYMALLEFLEDIFKKNIDLVIEKDLKPELKYVKKEAKYVKI